MHIGFLTSEYPLHRGSASGGIGTSIHNLAHALVELGERVTVFLYGQAADAACWDGEIQVMHIKNVYLPKLSWWFTRKKIANLVNLFVETQGLDVLEVPDWTGISAFMQLKCPVVMKLHGSDTYFCHLENRRVKPWNRFLERLAYQRADAVIAVSDFTGKMTNHLFRLAKQYEVIYNGVQINEQSTISSFPIHLHRPIILYFGTLIRKKGVLDIPAIFNQVHQQLPEARLFLAGGDAYDVLTGNTSTWDLMKPLFSESAYRQVTYLGRVPYPEIQPLISEAQVCIFPSYAEACPLAWLEAMAMRKAVVASDIGWAKELITDGEDGFLFHPSAHTKYAVQITHLLTDTQLLQAVGMKAQQKIFSMFSAEKIVNISLDKYQRVVKK